jgi:hypothetical protein
MNLQTAYAVCNMMGSRRLDGERIEKRRHYVWGSRVVQRRPNCSLLNWKRHEKKHFYSRLRHYQVLPLHTNLTWKELHKTSARPQNKRKLVLISNMKMEHEWIRQTGNTWLSEKEKGRKKEGKRKASTVYQANNDPCNRTASKTKLHRIRVDIQVVWIADGVNITSMCTVSSISAPLIER